MKKLIVVNLLLLTFGKAFSFGKPVENTITIRMEADVCVYGASGPGIAAAVAVAREGYSVVIVEPCHKIGGLLGSGFRMQQDVPYADHLGGLTGAFYDTDIAQPQPRHQQGAGKYNIKALQSMIDEYKNLIMVIPDHRLASVKKLNGSIKEAVFEFAPPVKDGVPVPSRLSEHLVHVSSSIINSMNK